MVVLNAVKYIKAAKTALVLAASLIAVASCAPQAEDGDELNYAEFKIALSAVSYLAHDNGHVENAGIDYTPISLEAGPDIIASLRSQASSSGHAGNIAVEPVAAMIAAGDRPIILATTVMSATNVRLVTFADNEITEDPATLRGKTVGVVLNTIGESYLDGLLASAGLAREDISLVNSRPTDLRASLVRGDLDAAILWDPFIAQVSRIYQDNLDAGAVADRGSVQVFVDPDIFTLQMNVVTTDRYLESYRPQLKNFLEALIAAEADIVNDRAGAQAQVEAWLELTPGDLSSFFGESDFTIQLDEPALEQSLEAAVRALQSRDSTVNIPDDFSVYIDNSLLAEIDPDRVR